MKPCGLFFWYRRFGGTCWNHLRVVKEEYFVVQCFVNYPEDGGSKQLLSARIKITNQRGFIPQKTLILMNNAVKSSNRILNNLTELCEVKV
jgi:hypothetical protein